MGCKLPGVSGVGYWGGNPRSRILADGTAQKVIALNFDKIQAMGIPYALWESVRSMEGSYTTCSCYKDTSKQSDLNCLSCYGQTLIPGYMRFGYNYAWMPSIDPGWVFTNLGLDTTHTPNRIQINAGQTTGTAVSAQIPVDTTSILGNFQVKVDAYARDTTPGANTIVVEFSSTAHLATPVWQSISVLPTLASLPFPYLQFRVTLTRNAVATKSPLFEIVRVRWQVVPDITPVGLGGLSEGVVRVLSTWDDEMTNRTNRGDNTDANGQVFWTLPLNVFDATRTNIKDQKVVDDCFVEQRGYGPEQGVRFALTNFNYSNNFGIFTRQQFNMRRIQGDGSGQLTGEYYYRVF